MTVLEASTTAGLEATGGDRRPFRSVAKREGGCAISWDCPVTLSRIGLSPDRGLGRRLANPNLRNECPDIQRRHVEFRPESS